MSSVNLKILALQQLYTGASGRDASGNITTGTGAGTSVMDAFRSAAGQNLASLDARIAAFENVAIDDVAKSGANAGDYPYDRASLKKEFMDEVLAFLLQSDKYRATVQGYDSLNPYAVSTLSAVKTDGYLRDAAVYNAVAIANTTPVLYQAGSTILLPNPQNFSALTTEQQKQLLNDTGDAIYEQYSDLIDALFAEGDKLKNNPTDAATGATVTANVVTAIKEVTVSNVTFDGVTTINGLTYLVEKGATIYDVNKTTVTNVAGQPVDFTLGFDPALTSTRYIRCDENGVPVGTTIVTLNTQRNLSPVDYLYYFMEARIKILRAKLAYKEAVVNEIRSDLLQAQSAYSDLEAQAGGARDRSEDGKTLNPNTTKETVAMDFWEAQASKSGTQLLYDAHDDGHNFTEWQTSRSQVKNYIDMKSTQSQDAMLDYQTTLNRYNSAYEVMSKLQEKMDGLVKSQLRNVS